jgi:hypothetical protein
MSDSESSDNPRFDGISSDVDEEEVERILNERKLLQRAKEEIARDEQAHLE